MKNAQFPVAYMPLVDAAPLIVAKELGFDEAEGISLDLIAAPSWSSVRDMLAFGRADAAHLLSVIPVASALSMGGNASQFDALSVMSQNGNVIGVGNALEGRLRDQGFDFDFADPAKAAAALQTAASEPLVFGVPFPFSMHVELLRYWLDHTGLSDTKVEVRTVPPPLMAEALASGDVDAFCVGEPWGSVAVEAGAGAMLLPGKSIWTAAPEKVLAVRKGWADTEPHLLGRLLRAVWRSGRWLAREDSRTSAAEILAQKAYLNMPSELIDRALSGRLTISQRGEQRTVPGFVEFHNGAANFPWRSQAKWIAHRLSQRNGVTVEQPQSVGAQVFRSDFYRREMRAMGVDLPGASEKVEGAIRTETAAVSEFGELLLSPDTFFDRQIFDPSAS